MAKSIIFERKFAMTGRMVGPGGISKEVKVGFSWTMFFFGPLVPLIRGDSKWFILSIVISLFTVGIGWLFLPFIYNKHYITDLMEKGYRPADIALRKELFDRGIVS